jgi:hypothetical protein
MLEWGAIEWSTMIATIGVIVIILVLRRSGR